MGFQKQYIRGVLKMGSFAIANIIATCTYKLFAKKTKTVLIPPQAILGSVHIFSSTYVDSGSRALQEKVLATALVRATKYGLQLMEDSDRGLVFMANAGTSARSCNQMMMFFTELKYDFAKYGMQLRFGMTRGHELQSAGRLSAEGSEGEVVLGRDLMQSMPAVRLKSRVIGQMRFAAA
jgi:hypothetical protein